MQNYHIDASKLNKMGMMMMVMMMARVIELQNGTIARLILRL